MASQSEAASSAASIDTTGIFTKRRKNIVGLLNQGGTCYLNCLLQTLFHTPEFTYRLFNLTSLHHKAGLKSIIRELLRLFYNLMTIKKFAISSKSLTNSFGWSDEQLFVHQDVQELNRLLFEEIEASLKGTVEANLINDLYKGSIVTKIKCLKCGNCSIREDEYLDVHLAVLEYDSVEKALKGLTAIEKLNGDNQYFCDKCKRKVDATKLTFFKEYPPILTLCLARFDFDPRTMQSIKVDKCCSFPLVLDVSDFLEKKQNTRMLYDLFSIVIHVGNSTLGGHYHAYIKDPYGFEIINEANENNIDDTKLNQDKREFVNETEDTSSSLCNCMHDSNMDDNDSSEMNRSSIINADYSTETLKPDLEKLHYPVINSLNSPKKVPNSSSYGTSGKFTAIFDAIRSLWSGSPSNNITDNSGDIQKTKTPTSYYSTQIPTQLNHANVCLPPDISNEIVTEYDPSKLINQSLPFIEQEYQQNNTKMVKSSSTSFNDNNYYLIDTNNNEPMEEGLLNDNPPSNLYDSNPSMQCQEINEANNINSKLNDDKIESSSSKHTPTNSWSFTATPTKMKFKQGTTGNADNEEGGEMELKASSNSDSNNDLPGSKSPKKDKSKFIDKGRWFDFNDETITEIKTQDFNKVYAGQECAYMLFYRSRQITSPKI